MWPTSRTPADAPGATEGSTVPAYCRVAGVIDRRTGTDDVEFGIGFELRLPDGWNRRFFFQGGAGTAGAPLTAGSGDTFFAVVEFSTPIHAEGLLSYGNWSKKGSRHIEDQLQLMWRKEMRPIWKDRKDIEAQLEAKKAF